MIVFFGLLVQYCFLKIIRRELSEVRHWWNHHRIRKQALGDDVSGIPDILYHNTELGVEECRNFIHDVNVNGQKFTFLKSLCGWNNDVAASFKLLMEELCQLYHLKNDPETVEEGHILYLSLRVVLEKLNKK